MTAGKAGNYRRDDERGHSATWWDYDGDGWPDLYVANDFATPDFLYHNNRDGTFTNTIHTALVQIPHSSMGSDARGRGQRRPPRPLSSPMMAASTREKDQRGMAKIRALHDLRARAAGRNLPASMRSMLLLGTGTEQFREGAYLAGIAATDWMRPVRVSRTSTTTAALTSRSPTAWRASCDNADLVQDISASESAWMQASGWRKLRQAFAERNSGVPELRGGLAVQGGECGVGLGSGGREFWGGDRGLRRGRGPGLGDRQLRVGADSVAQRQRDGSPAGGGVTRDRSPTVLAVGATVWIKTASGPAGKNPGAGARVPVDQRA